MRGRTWIAAIVVIGTRLAGAAPATRSAPTEAEDSQIAVALFGDAKQLMARHDWAPACAKLEAAHARVAWLGVTLNLADCDEHLGKTASAWVLFLEAAAEADRQADERGDFARARAAQLEARLARVMIHAGDNEQIQLDGELLGAAVLGVAVPVDPGAHVIVAAAPGHVTWTRQLTAVAGAAVRVDVPALEAAHRPVPATPELVPLPSLHTSASARSSSTHIGVDELPRRTWRRWPVWGTAGAGLAIVGASLLFGVDAKLRFETALDGHCTASLQCDGTGYQAVRDARLRGDVATGLGVAGGAALVAAGLLYVFTNHHVTPVVTPTSAGVVVQGAL